MPKMEMERVLVTVGMEMATFSCVPEGWNTRHWLIGGWPSLSGGTSGEVRFRYLLVDDSSIYRPIYIPKRTCRIVLTCVLLTVIRPVICMDDFCCAVSFIIWSFHRQY